MLALCTQTCNFKRFFKLQWTLEILTPCKVFARRVNGSSRCNWPGIGWLVGWLVGVNHALFQLISTLICLSPIVSVIPHFPFCEFLLLHQRLVDSWLFCLDTVTPVNHNSVVCSEWLRVLMNISILGSHCCKRNQCNTSLIYPAPIIEWVKVCSHICSSSMV